MSTHAYSRGSSSVSDQETYSYVNNNYLERKAQLCRFDQAPVYLQTNPYLHGGYRLYLSKGECLKSVFRWTNETINIWSHLLGFLFFFGLLVYDVYVTIPRYFHSYSDIAVMMLFLLCCMICTGCSTAYHIFCCYSEDAYFNFLKYDIVGIVFAFASIFISGIHYGYSCFPDWRVFYQCLISVLTVLVLLSVIRNKERSFKVDKQRMIIFILWALFGVVPCLHWAYLEGGFVGPLIRNLLPRVGVTYAILGTAFFVYISRYPERCCPGRLDYIGSSHQLWHVLCVVTMFWWHQTGITYAELKNYYGCANENTG